MLVQTQKIILKENDDASLSSGEPTN